MICSASVGAAVVSLGLSLGAAVPVLAVPARAGIVQHADRQAALVEQEDLRIKWIRSLLAGSLHGGPGTVPPQIFGNGSDTTLVLPPRARGRPYTFADLHRIWGGYVRRLRDGSYLLSAHVFVAEGATLLLSSAPGPLHLRMGSGPGAISSIVSSGGRVRIEGTARDPVRISSWDAAARRPDVRVSDGRAYLRAVGGSLSMKHVRASHLGFGSGRTGGIALTGASAVASAGPVTGSIEESVISGGVHGLFVSEAERIRIVGNRIEGSLVHGVLLHRLVRNATIRSTTVRGSRRDGFVVSWATERIRLDDCVAERNGRNGFTLNGRPPAKGRPMAGEPSRMFGGNSVSGGVARNNSRYGVELIGGRRPAVLDSRIIGGAMGIVARGAATGVRVSGNRLESAGRQGIVLRDGVRGAALRGNTVIGSRTGLYVRSANASLAGNVVRDATLHALALRGDTGGTAVHGNTFSGSGATAVSTDAASHGTARMNGNDTQGWDDTTPLWATEKIYVKPMNVIWLLVLLVLAGSASWSRARRGVYAIGMILLRVERDWKTVAGQRGTRVIPASHIGHFQRLGPPSVGPHFAVGPKGGEFIMIRVALPPDRLAR